MLVPAKTNVSSRLFSAIAEIIGDDTFSSSNPFTQMKVLVWISNNPAIASVKPTCAPGNADYVLVDILTYPPL